MSILIKGMEMPDCCDHCPLFDDEYQHPYWCMALNKQIDVKINEKYADCPIIEVPPHGRLIDADALMLGIQEYIDEYGWDVDEHGFHSEKWCAMKETEMAINDATTVIPADKDGET